MLELSNYNIKEVIIKKKLLTIYRAIRKEDQKSVIIKYVPSYYAFQDFVFNLQNKYNLVSSLDPKYTIKAISFEKIAEGYIIVYEDGGILLKKHLIENKRLSVVSFLKVAIRLIEILSYIHQQGIIHRDINPSNFIIRESAEIDIPSIKIINFDISTQVTKEEIGWKSSNSLYGSLPYISPEQTGRLNKYIDYRSDFYSLGISYYELLTGRLPFESKEPSELIYSHISLDPKKYVKIIPGIPEAIYSIIFKLMEKNSEDRYQSALGLKEDLEYCLKLTEENKTNYNFPLGKKDISDKFQIPQKLYGREKEIDELLNIFKKVCNGSTEILFVSGYSGIGKTAFIQETYKPITLQNGYFIFGKFEQFQKNIFYGGLIEAFKELVQYILIENENKLEEWKELIIKKLGTSISVIVNAIPDMECFIDKQEKVLESNYAENQNLFNIAFQNLISIFSQKRIPLVLFLEDLQWIDLSSLALLKEIIIGSDSKYFFIICSYRSNEVDRMHPISSLIDEISNRGKRVNTILLNPLKEVDVLSLLSDTLKQENLHELESLSKLLTKKTGGNPFFLSSFLKTLYKEGLIYFDYNNNSWLWKENEIFQYDVTDNIVDLLILKINQLSIETKNILSIASCIGNRFELSLLHSIMNNNAKNLFQSIWILIDEDIITPLENTQLIIKEFQINHFKNYDITNKIIFKFQHDKILEAAYSLLDENSKKNIHSTIAKVILKNTPQEDIEDKVLAIVNHLNLGNEPKDNIDLAQQLDLNLKASQKARASTAYEQALEYIRKALDLFHRLYPENAWKSNYSLAILVYKRYAEIEFLNSNLKDSEKKIEYALNQTTIDMDRVELYRLLIEVYLRDTKYPEALNALRKALLPLGVWIPADNYNYYIQEEEKKINSKLANKTIQSLLYEQEVIDNEKKIAIQILTTTTPVFFLFSPELWSFIVLKTVNLYLEYGNLAESYGYACYGIYLGSAKGDYKNGYLFSKLAYDISDKFNNLSEKCKVANVLANHVQSWMKPLSHSNKINQEGFTLGLKSGEYNHWGYCALHHSLNLFYQGRNLEALKTEIENLLTFFLKTKNGLAINSIRGTSLIVNNLLQIDNPHYDIEEKDYFAKCKESNDAFSICLYNILKLQLYYLYNNLENAIVLTGEISNYIKYVNGEYSIAEYNFYSSLIFAKMYENNKEEIYLKKINENQYQMKIWADNCRENFLHKFYIAEGEKERILENYYRALELYDLSIQEANKNGFIQNEAIACELAGKLYLFLKNDKLGYFYLSKSIELYLKWGAIHKIECLKKEYPLFIKKTYTIDSKNIYTRKSLNNYEYDLLDTSNENLISIMKAFQSILGETSYNKLIKRLIKVLLENFNAEKVFLISVSDQSLYLEASGYGKNKIKHFKKKIPLQEANEYLPVEIILDTFYGKSNVLIKNASLSEQFSKIGIVVKNNIKSISSSPIFYKGNITTIVYLENNSMAGAFTKEKNKILNIFLSQAIIAIENTKLYNDIESAIRQKKVEDMEVKIAKEIQTALIIDKPTIHGYEISTYIKPANEMGGDYYDIISDEGVDWIAIGDVSGHGLSASIIMTMVQTSVRTAIMYKDSIQDKMYKVNQIISQSLQKMNLDDYITFTLIKKDKDDFYYSGLHEDILVYRKEFQKVERIEIKGSWIGMKDFYEEFFVEKFSLSLGDVLLLYTDGLINLLNVSTKQRFGIQNLIQVFEKSGEKPVEEIKEILLSLSNEYTITDDIAFLIIKKLE